MSPNITILSFSIGSVNEGKNSKIRCFYNYNFEFNASSCIELDCKTYLIKEIHVKRQSLELLFDVK